MLPGTGSGKAWLCLRLRWTLAAHVVKTHSRLRRLIYLSAHQKQGLWRAADMRTKKWHRKDLAIMDASASRPDGRCPGSGRGYFGASADQPGRGKSGLHRTR